MKCKNCRNLVKRIDDDGTLYDFCGMVIDSPDTDRERNCKYYVTATNADRIRSMSDEELVKFFFHADEVVPWCDESRGHHKEANGCEKCMLDWLKEEAE